MEFADSIECNSNSCLGMMLPDGKSAWKTNDTATKKDIVTEKKIKVPGIIVEKIVASTKTLDKHSLY